MMKIAYNFYLNFIEYTGLVSCHNIVSAIFKIVVEYVTFVSFCAAVLMIWKQTSGAMKKHVNAPNVHYFFWW